MRRPFRRRDNPELPEQRSGAGEAEKAIAEGISAKAEVMARRPRVERVARELEELRIKNGFAEGFYRTLAAREEGETQS
jgi:hypothetical protein